MLTQQLEKPKKFEPPIGEVKLATLKKGDIPQHWKGLERAIMRYAVTFGYIVPGWTARNYIEDAIESKGYELCEIWGKQGSGKSCRMLQQGFWVYDDWDVVLNNIVMMIDAKDMPKYKKWALLSRIQEIEKGFRMPWLGIDDLTVDLPSSSWRTDIEKYEAVDSFLAAVRTSINVLSISNPIIDRLPKNVKDNITLEFFIGPNQVEQIERIVRLSGLNRIECNFFKVLVEPLHRFNLYDVPKEVFKQYEDLRFEITDYAKKKMAHAYAEEPDSEQWISAGEVAKELKISPLSAVQFIREGIVEGKKFGKKLYIKREDFENELKLYYLQRQKGKSPTH